MCFVFDSLPLIILNYFKYIFFLNRSGKVVLDIPFPVKQVTAVSFGGPNLDILYAITAADGDTAEHAGRLFKVTGLGAKGFQGDKVKL